MAYYPSVSFLSGTKPEASVLRLVAFVCDDRRCPLAVCFTIEHHGNHFAHLHGCAGAQLGLAVLGGEVGVEVGLEDGDLDFGHGGIPFGGKDFGVLQIWVCRSDRTE